MKYRYQYNKDNNKNNNNIYIIKYIYNKQPVPTESSLAVPQMNQLKNENILNNMRFPNNYKTSIC